MLTGKTNEEKIWNYLTTAGLTACGAAGLMGNLYAESGLISTNLQNTCEKKLGYTDAAYTAAVDSGAYTNFARDSAGYGLAQWTYHTRKANLYKFAKDAGKSIGDLEMQLAFLVCELESSFSAVLSTLKTARTVKAASDAVLLKFERPASQGETVKLKRASYGQTYYDKFAAGQAAEVGTKMNKKPVSFLQTDARWKNKPYRVKGENATIGDSGCGPTAAAMLLSTLRVDVYFNFIGLVELPAKPDTAQPATAEPPKEKYVAVNTSFAPLGEYLSQQTEDSVSLSFTKVEKVIGKPLCKSAFKFYSYWYPGHNRPISNVIYNAGFDVDRVDLKNQKIRCYT